MNHFNVQFIVKMKSVKDETLISQEAAQYDSVYIKISF